MFACMSEISRLLISAREAELGRGVQRIELQCMLESVDCLGILLTLGVGGAQEIPRVRIVRINFGDSAEGIDRGMRIRGVFFQHAEVIPGVRIIGILFHGLLKKLPCRIDAPQVEQRDALIHESNLEIWIKRGRLFKHLQSLFEELLIHVGNAETIETSGLGGFFRLLCTRSTLRNGREDSNSRQNDDGANDGNHFYHAKTKSTSKDTRAHKGKSDEVMPEFEESRHCMDVADFYLGARNVSALLNPLFATTPLPS